MSCLVVIICIKHTNENQLSQHTYFNNQLKVFYNLGLTIFIIIVVQNFGIN